MLAAIIMGAAAAAGSQEQRQPASGDGLGDWTEGAQLGTASAKMWAEAWLRLWRLRRRLRWPRQRQRRGSYAHIAQHKVSIAALSTKK